MLSQAERPYWNMEIEPFLNSPKLVAIQLKRLKIMLARLEANAPFYTQLFKKIKLDPEKITSMEMFRNTVPLFNKDSLKQIASECEGDILKTIEQIIPVGLEDLDWISTTTGTTGIPTPYPMTNFDIEHLWGEAMLRGCWRAGIRSQDRILYCFALSMVIAGIPTMMGIQRSGATIIPVGAEAKSEQILLMQSLFKGTIYVGTPSLAEYLVEQAPKILGKTAAQLGFKSLICGGEPGAGIPEVRAKLENAYECKIYDAGAGFGFSCDHETYQGMHWLGDDLVYYELVDPETKAPIPMENGAKGEAVFTCLQGDGWVMMRQSMGDIHQVFTEPCACGRTGFRYKVIGRSDDMLKIKGVMVYPSHIKGIINEFVPNVTGEMRIVLDEHPPRVVPPLKIKVEAAKPIKGSNLKQLETEICNTMKKRIKINPEIIWQDPGSLERSHYKGQVFEKTYEKK